MRYIIIITFVLLSVSVGGCRRSSSQNESAYDINMALVAEPTAPVVGSATLRITLTDTNDEPINDASLEIRGDMAHAGMEPVLTSVDADQAGVYEVPFEWTMGGDWIVTVIATLADGRSVTREFDLTVSGGMDMESGS